MEPIGEWIKAVFVFLWRVSFGLKRNNSPLDVAFVNGNLQAKREN
jgi:hypothetical protein